MLFCLETLQEALKAGLHSAEGSERLGMTLERNGTWRWK
jgi:hypothetical protein